MYSADSRSCSTTRTRSAWALTSATRRSCAGAAVTEPGRGRLLHLVDTSALARAAQPGVRRVLAGLLAEEAAATCVTVDLEAGYSGRTADEVRVIADRRRSVFVVLPLDEAIAERARDVQLRMAARGHHRAAGVVDLLTAAVAEQHGALLRYYDGDFEHIAATTGQPQLWIAPRGTLE